MGVCILLGISPEMKAVKDQPGQKYEDYFEPSKKELLASPSDLLDRLFSFAKYEKNNISGSAILKLENKVFNDPEYNYERVRKANLAASYLFQWTKAMYDYYKIFERTKP